MRLRGVVLGPIRQSCCIAVAVGLESMLIQIYTFVDAGFLARVERRSVSAQGVFGQ
ncbi:hypothetical protein SBBP2_1290011 [Burkholderiales bacterium]|nr:hypothetical protein SBBP2_1290011 [Burkholderiales bacterium]